MEINVHAKIYHFSKYRGLMPENDPLSLISRNSRLIEKIPLFFANVGTSMVYALVTSGCGGGGSCSSKRTKLTPLRLVKLPKAPRAVLMVDLGNKDREKGKRCWHKISACYARLCG